MRTTALQKKLNIAAGIYDKSVIDIAEDARIKFIIPFCDKCGYSFITGLGGWSFVSVKTGKHVDDWDIKLPKKVISALEAELLYSHNSLGSLMQDYTPKRA